MSARSFGRPVARLLRTNACVKVSLRSALLGAAVVLSIGDLFVAGAGCSRRVDDYGISQCPAGATGDLLASNALQCWLAASHGRWRTLSHQEAYGALVVEIEAADLADAGEIARRFVDGRREAISEISVYVQRESTTGPPLIRRVRWTPDAGYEILDFSSPTVP